MAHGHNLGPNYILDKPSLLTTIPLPFEEALAAAVEVKPPEPERRSARRGSPRRAELLPQPHGFEGFPARRVAFDPHDLSVLERPHREERPLDNRSTRPSR